MLRICHPADFKGFFFYEKKTGQFAGTFSSVFNEPVNLIRQGMSSLVNNFSLVIESSASLNISQASSENFQGCIPAIQNNRSDLLFALVEYPSRHLNVTQGLTVFDTVLTLGSMYQKDVTGEVAQSLDSFKSFSFAVWFMCLVTFCSLSLLLKVKNYLVNQRRNQYNLLCTGTHMMRLNAMSDVGLIRKIIFLCASLYSLVVVHYFCTLIKTELVTTRDPVVFRSYQDIIDRRVQPVFAEGMSFDVFFSSEDAPQFRRSLWKYATTHFRLEDLYVEMNPVQFFISALAILMETNVVIVDSLVMPVIPASGCPLVARDPRKFVDFCNKISSVSLGPFSADKLTVERFERSNPNFHLDHMPGFNFFTAVDPNERSYILSILTNEQMASQIHRSFHATFRKVIEAGLHLHILGRLKSFNAIAQFEEINDLFGRTNKSRLHLAQECESCTIIKPDSDFHPLKLQNFQTLFTLMAALMPVFFMILLLENYH